MRASASSFIVAGLLVAAGCAGGDSGDYPILPGGGDPGAQTSSPTLRGRVCLATDLRDFGTCAETGAGGLAVSAGTAATITEDDGSFEMARPASGSAGDFLVSGPGVVATFNPFSA